MTLSFVTFSKCELRLATLFLFDKLLHFFFHYVILLRFLAQPFLLFNKSLFEKAAILFFSMQSLFEKTILFLHFLDNLILDDRVLNFFFLSALIFRTCS